MGFDTGNGNFKMKIAMKMGIENKNAIPND